MTTAKKTRITNFFYGPSTSSNVDDPANPISKVPSNKNNNKQVPETGISRKLNHKKFRYEWREDLCYKSCLEF
jgi:hypothetical protein